MTERSVIHTTFTLQRHYPVPPATVFAAWSDPVAKARWFAGSGVAHELDFRVGGIEVTTATGGNGSPLRAESRYHDIVHGERIVYATTLSSGPTLATVSTTTVEFTADGDGTKLSLIEQDAFLDGHEEPAWRERGTSDWLSALGEELRANPEATR